MKPVNLLNLIPRDLYHESFPILVNNFIFPENYEIPEIITPTEILGVMDGEEFTLQVETERQDQKLIIHRVLSASRPQLFLDKLNNLEPDSYFQSTPAHEKLLQLFFQQAPVKVAQHEGQRVLGKTLLLGTRLGPLQHTLEGLVHEMAHTIELPASRLLQDGWGFSYGEEVEVLGQTFFEPATMQATDRECKTIAIQLVIYDLIGYPYSIPDEVKALVYMNDFLHVPGVKESERLKFLADLVTQYKRALSSDQILENWAQKMEYLKN